MSINSKLVSFAQQELVLARNDNERIKINNSLNHLEKILTNGLGVELRSLIRFGSWQRNTILPRKHDSNSDVDLLVLFQNSNLTPGTYRTKLKKIVEYTYPNSLSKKDFPVVKLELNHIMFDLVPAVYTISSFWKTETLYIPEDSSNWRKTTPNDINDPLSNANTYYGNNIVRNVIRLCKHWNAYKNYPFESYLMEKAIIELDFSGDNTYSGFLYALQKLANDISGVEQAIYYIKQYISSGDEAKQLLWLQKLLPNL